MKYSINIRSFENEKIRIIYKISDIRLKILELIEEFSGEDLSVRVIQTILKISSPSVVHYHLKYLEKRRIIERFYIVDIDLTPPPIRDDEYGGLRVIKWK